MSTRAPVRILHTAAHPADAFDMVGGTLAHHVGRGDSVTVIVFSHGARSHAHDTIEGKRVHDVAVRLDEAVDRKENEVVEACALLGIDDVRFLRHDDHLLLLNADNIRAMAEFVRELRPDVVITHSPFEPAASPHRVCCEITQQGIGVASGIMDGIDSPPHRVGEIFYMFNHGETTLMDHAHPRFPAILVDVSDVIEQKLKALQCIDSQLYGGDFARKMLENVNGQHGLHRCVPYSEAFMRHFPEVCTHLPLSQHNLDLATRPMEETYARMSELFTNQPGVVT